MTLTDILQDNKSSILGAWIDSVLAEFPDNSLKFIKKQGDRFANPLGFQIANGLTQLYDAVCRDASPREISPLIEQFIKLRAVQDLRASEAVAFVFKLKKLIRMECRKKKVENHEELTILDGKIDEMALQVFDQYAESRERLFDVRIQELKSGNFILTDLAQCPSALLRKNRLAKKEMTTINLHSS